MTDRVAIALTLYGEDRGGTTAGRLAIASVIENRRKSGRWGATFEAVCLAPKQFSCWNLNDPNRSMLDKLIGVTPVDPLLRECLWIADGLIEGVILPQVRDAMHYYAVSMPHPPVWVMGATVVAQLDGHRFLSGVL